MRNIFLLFILTSFCALTTQAQEDQNIKLNPLPLIIGSINMSYEQAINDGFAIQVNPGYWTGFEIDNDDFTGFQLGVEGRFYISKDSVAPDGIYAGPYVNYTNLSLDDEDVTLFAVGGEFGHQWIYDSGFVLDLNIGGGVTSVNSDDNEVEDDVATFLPKFTFAIGYNF